MKKGNICYTGGKKRAKVNGMKKYFVGFLAGVLLTFSMSVYADDIKSLIGQKVQGTVSVVVNGAKVKDGVIINSTSYAPVRSLTEAAGLDVGFEKGVVTVNDTAGMVNVTGKPKVWTAEQIDSNITSLNDLKKIYTDQIDRYKLLLQDESLKNEWTTYQTTMEKVQLSLNQCQDRIDELNALKAALQ